MRIDIDSLNPAQREAVECTSGPLLVLAGAGSGKTRVLTYRIAHMIADEGVRPWQILAITFTNKAATEMRERLAKLLPGETRGMWVCTFHAMCVRMLREDPELIGYKPNFTIYDDDDSRRLVKTIMSDLDIDAKQFPLNAIRARISTAKNAMVLPDEMAGTAVAPLDRKAAQVYEVLQNRLERANAMDFDDLLVKAYQLLSKNPGVLAKYQERFQHISVVAFQYTNNVQYQITNLLAARYKNLMVVGDDDQSIYSWRGADIRNILAFEKDYPDARVVKLEQNYRSTGHILSAANAVVAHNSRRTPKRLFTNSGDGERVKLYQAADERDEGRWIGAQIEQLHDKGTSYDDMAVFYRTNAQSRALEDMFLRAGVPYRIVGGTRFYDRAEIRDVMAYLKVVVNPDDDVACERVINTPRRGIGTTSINKIRAYGAQHNLSLFDAAEACIAETGILSAKVRTALGEFCGAIEHGRHVTGELGEVVEAIVDKAGLIRALEAEHTDEAAGRIENIREFFGVASEFDETHDDVQETLESLEQLRAAGAITTPTDSPADGALAASFGASGGGQSAAANDAPSTTDSPADGALAAGFGAYETGMLTDGGGMSGDGHPAGAPFAPRTSVEDMPPARTQGLSAEDASKPPIAAEKLPAFMEWLALRTDLDALAGQSRAITMMTVHSAKGLEFPVVFVAGLEEGLFPHMGHDSDPASIEEERRLAYVAITRAQKRLFLTYASTRHVWGSVQANPRSRFLNEIPSDDLEPVGVGSAGFSGVGWEKRGDRHGTFGSGRGSEVYGGRVFGSHTRSTGGSRDDARPKPVARDAAKASETFAPGDHVSHKTFGPGVVVSAKGDTIEVRFTRTGAVKKLMKGFAPIVKVE